MVPGGQQETAKETFSAAGNCTRIKSSKGVHLFQQHANSRTLSDHRKHLQTCTSPKLMTTVHRARSNITVGPTPSPRTGAAPSHNAYDPGVLSGTRVELPVEVWAIVCSYLQASTPDLIRLAGTCWALRPHALAQVEHHSFTRRLDSGTSTSLGTPDPVEQHSRCWRGPISAHTLVGLRAWRCVFGASLTF